MRHLSFYLLKHFKLIKLIGIAFFGSILLSAPLLFCLYLGFWIGRWTKGLRLIRDTELEEIRRKMIIHDAVAHDGPQVSEDDRIHEDYPGHEELPAVADIVESEEQPVISGQALVEPQMSDEDALIYYEHVCEDVHPGAAHVVWADNEEEDRRRNEGEQI